MSKLRAILDANVLYDSFLRDLLMSLFSAGMYEAKWTKKLLKNGLATCWKNRPDISPPANARTVQLMNQIQPTALVWAYEQFMGQVELPDKDDQHVVAAALACGAQKNRDMEFGRLPK